MKRQRNITATTTQKNFLKKLKKVVDKHNKVCYSKQAVAETAKNKTLNLDNKTVYSNPENSLNEFLEQNLNIGK